MDTTVSILLLEVVTSCSLFDFLHQMTTTKKLEDPRNYSEMIWYIMPKLIAFDHQAYVADIAGEAILETGYINVYRILRKIAKS